MTWSWWARRATAQALALAHEHDPDVILMDLAMPVLDGLAAIARLASEATAPPSSCLTMTEDDAGVFAAIRAGAQGYLVKGVAPDQVRQRGPRPRRGQRRLRPARRQPDADVFRRAAGRRNPSVPGLSPREREFSRCWPPAANQEIAGALVISPITARNHVSSILAKLQVANRREAMLRFHRPSD